MILAKASQVRPSVPPLAGFPTEVRATKLRHLDEDPPRKTECVDETETCLFNVGLRGVP